MKTTETKQRIKELKADIKEAQSEKDRLEKLASSPLTEQGLYNEHYLALDYARSQVALHQNTLEHFKERSAMYKHN